MLILLNCSQLLAQDEKPANKKVWCLDSIEVLQVRKDYAKLVHLEEKDSLQHQKDSVANLRVIDREERINNLQTEILGKDEQIELFKQREANLELVPALRWDGFHLGVTAAYPFDDAVITQQTVIAGLRFDVTATARVLILGKLTGMLQAGVPIRSEKFYLKFGAEWRVF